MEWLCCVIFVGADGAFYKDLALAGLGISAVLMVAVDV